MAQVLKLKRTAVQGKVPTTSSLELGELAVNTYDGKIYFEKDNGIPSVQSVLVTDATITGSLNLIGAITASYFKGDGSQITNLPASDISQVATINYAFFNSSNIAVSHNFNSRNVIVSVYDSNYAQIIPSSVTLTDLNTATIVLSSAQSGYAVVAKGGHIVSGSADDSNNLNGEAGSYYLNFNNHTNIPSGLVSGSSQIITNLPSGVVSGSSQIAISSATGYTTFSSSLDSRIVSLNAFTASENTKSTTLGTYTSSIDSKFTTLGTYTGSIDTKWSTLQNVTSSLINATASYETKGRGIVSGSSQIVSILDPLNTYSSSLKTALELTGSNVIVLGDLSVRGTTTTINSTTIQLDDNIISLNAAGTSNGGIIVRDATGGTTNSGSLVWDVTNDYWKAGISGSESKLLRANGDSVVSGSAQITLGSTAGYSTYSGSVYTSLTALETKNSSLVTYTASLETKNSTLATYTGSINTKFSTLGTYTGSIDTKWSTLQGVTSSLINATSSYETRGNGIVSSSTQIVSSLNDKSVNFGTGSITASYFVGDGSGITNVVTEIAEVATITSSFDNQSTIAVTHNFNTKNVIVSVYGTNDAQIIPSSVTLTNNNTATIVLSSADSGYAVVAKGGHIVSGSTDWNSVVNRPSGLVSGSSQITSLTTYKETITGNSIYTITHNLNEEYPIVQAWNTSNKRQEIPSIIESISVNAISLTFSGTFSGLIIVKK